MGWKTHVLRLAVLGRVPFGNTLRRIKRKVFGYMPDEGNLQNTLANFSEMKDAVEKVGHSFVGATVLEIGSGWFPTIPIMLSATGAHKVFLTDLTPHLDKTTFAATLDFLKPHLRQYPGVADKTTMEQFGLEYIAPFRIDLIPDHSIDFVISRTVLEHIPTDVLQSLLVQLRPKLSSQGLMVHYIDHSDHLEHKDRSISKINFLTWSDWQHKFVNWLTKEGENRLRHHEYRELFEKSGFEIVSESGQPHTATVEWSKQQRLLGRFAPMTPEEVSILSSVYLLSPRVGTAEQSSVIS